MSALAQTIARLLPNGLGARGDEERDPVLYPARPLHVLLATSGSVASIKAPLIVNELLKVCHILPVGIQRCSLTKVSTPTFSTSR